MGTAIPKRRFRRYRLRRLLFLVWNVLATLRMLIQDRQPLRAWPSHLLGCLGFFRARARCSIWIHGEGMGEFNAAAGVVERLRDRLPGFRLVFTASRSATLAWLRRRFPADIVLPHPWDAPLAPARFFARLNPRLILVLEYHDGFCPGALLRARADSIPVAVINARRLHAAKPRRYHVADRLGLVRQLAPCVDLFCVQDLATGDTLESISQAQIVVTGNLKYDMPTSAAPLATDFPVLVAGCIHADEEKLVVESYAALRSHHPDLRLIVAPLDPAQAAKLNALLKDAGIEFRLRSAAEDITLDSPVLILDTFGELASAYRLATVVMLGGSFTPSGGGHSLVEPAAHGKPIVVGPYMDSQRPMLQTFLADEAVIQCRTSELVTTLASLLRDPARRAALGERARAVVERESGATERTLTALDPYLPGRDVPVPLSLAKRAIRGLANTAFGQRLLAARSGRLPTLEALRTRLGNPQTILCLGNGPSSEDFQLDGVKYDSLFRVNWRWLERGRFAHPDVVFTGDRESLRRCPPCIFGFRTIAEELSVLLHTFFGGRRPEYFTVERLPLPLNQRWPARPTNGAVMIAVAAALRPRRLIIAGIDLFQHPTGSYPGETGTNQYAAMHDRAVELAIIRQALADFPGEVVIVGESLESALGTTLSSAS
jgi:3-deoxy-D-manno-octulosonic-acid transferase